MTMFLEESNKILQFISAFLLIFFAIIILLQKRGQRAPRIFLSGFFISRALIILFFASYFYSDLIYHVPDLYVLGEPFLYLYAPFLFLYTLSVSTNNFRFRWVDILHFVPAMVVLAYFLVYFHFFPSDLKIQMLLGDSLFAPFIVNGKMLWVQFIAYAVACTYLLVLYRMKIKLYNSSYNHELYHWLIFLVGAFLVWKGIFVSGYLSGIISGEYQNLFMIFIELSFLFYASMIAYKGLQMPHVVLSLREDRSYQTSPLTTDDRQEMLSKLKLTMNQEKPYLDPELTLNQLANQCGIPVHHLSQILNKDLKRNFYTYINEQRVEEAKLRLADPKNEKLTILEILYDVGFNSKSVFNTAFKKNTGMTPTDYRKKMLSQDAA
jgi:AraC-like DNA-binding protein